MKIPKKRQVFFARKPAMNFNPSTEIRRAQLKIFFSVARRHRIRLDVCATLTSAKSLRQVIVQFPWRGGRTALP
jgi:hypothetical protein